MNKRAYIVHLGRKEPVSPLVHIRLQIRNDIREVVQELLESCVPFRRQEDVEVRDVCLSLLDRETRLVCAITLQNPNLDSVLLHEIDDDQQLAFPGTQSLEELQPDVKQLSQHQ